jgi:DNA repair protein SbcD/Mre11
MVKFAHLADCHLGSWRQQELQDLNFLSFKKIIEKIIQEDLDFVLISGDLFDSAYPPIEILKQTFAEFKKLKDANLPVYLIAGSHDYSASGKTFLDVIEKAGLCKNIENQEIQENGKIELKPTLHKDIAIYGYAGKKSSLEIEDLKKVYFKENHPKTIFMIHTTINDIIGNIDMNSIDKQELPIADYYAMGHIHQVFTTNKENSVFVYPGPTYPNNFQELVDLQCGSFQITEFTDKIRTTNIKVPIKEVVFLEIELENALIATEIIIEKLNKINLNDKILLLKLKGTLRTGKSGDIKFNEIEEFINKKQIYSYLRNISQLKTRESGIQLNSSQIGDVEEVEKVVQKEFISENPHSFNSCLPQLMNALSTEKNEDEKSTTFETRLLDDLRNLLKLDKIL